MLETIFTKIATGITVAIIGIAGFFTPATVDYQNEINLLHQRIDQLEEDIAIDDITLGATNFVGGGYYKLAGSGIGTTDTTLTLQSFKMPVSNQEFTMGDFGSIGYLTLEPGTSKKEFISFTGLDQASSTDLCTISGVTRGLNFVSPYDASTSLRQSHSGGTRVIVSNPPQLYNWMAVRNNTGTISAVWTFQSTTMPRLDSYLAPTFNYQLAAKGYVDAVATSGAPNASFNTAGLVELATASELLVGTATSGVDTYLSIPTELVHQSSSAAHLIPITLSTGKLGQDWLDLSKAFTFSGGLTSSGSTIVSGALDVTGSSTMDFVAFSSIPTIPINTPTLSNEIASALYVNSSTEDVIGAYSEVIAVDQLFKATTSGFVSGYCNFNADASQLSTTLGIGSTTAATDMVITVGNAVDEETYTPITIPVPKDWYFNASSAGKFTTYLKWFPTQ